SVGLAAACLAGCGLQAPGSGPATLPQTSAARSAAHHAALTVSYQQLYRFDPQKNGTHPAAELLDVKGTLYGTTSRGGLSHGTIYTISTSGVHKVLYRFHAGSDGADPQAGLVDVNGTFYGTTAGGGSSSAGTVYAVSTSGAEKVLYSFKGGSDGASPEAGLIDVKGTLYGTTTKGGGSGCYSGLGCGTVFSLNTSGQETVLHRFAGGSDGSYPLAALIDVKGLLYGTAANDGSCQAYGNSCGTVYSITPAGVEKVIYDFQGGSDGVSPLSGLTDVNGMLYGTTTGGGQRGSDCYGSGCGTVYRVSTRGGEKVLYRFADGSDGAQPQSGLTDVNGRLYGTTQSGGGGSCFQVNGNCGTLYGITTAGIETVLYRFAGGTDGFVPVGGLTNVNGTLYGITYDGGDHDVCCASYGFGTVFTLSP
ncbi:MAG: choice-of-anchor tandem repeat GloVer-containing protein, partial [Candidatus Cybelea sp.]